jgi:hypothetical protein
MNIPLTTSASSATTGSLKIGNGTAATNVGIGGGNINAGGNITAAGAVNSQYFTQTNGRLTMSSGSSTNLRITIGTTSGWAIIDNNSGSAGAVLLGAGAGNSGFFSSGTTAKIRLADNSADASLTCLNLTASGTLAVTGASTLTGLLTANGGITLGDAQNIAFNATTGTKIGAATTQKLSFWNATPIVQPTTAVASATVASPGGGTNLKTDDTFDGYTIAQVVKALRNAGLLA